jgi:DNA-binding NarL/FixJ family response regulator
MDTPADAKAPPRQPEPQAGFETCAGAQSERPGLVILSEIRFLRESLAELIARDGALRVLGAGATLPEAAALCRRTRPALVLLDAGFSGARRAVAKLSETGSGARVVVFAVTETEESVIAWAEAGAAGYVPSTAAMSELVALLLAIIAGTQPCSARVAAGLFRRVAGLSRPAPSALLTMRERQIMGMIGAGMSNKDIARRLNIGVATTKSHVHNLLGKLKIQRRGQAAGLLYDEPPAGLSHDHSV